MLFYLYPVVLVATAVVLAWPCERATSLGWGWFWAWVAAGGLFAFSVLTGFSIGLFVLPLAAGALLFVAARAPRLASLGLVAGAGAIALLVGIVNVDQIPAAGAPQGTSSGGLDPIPWLAAGLAAVSAAVVGYAAVSRR